jgi:hypothetical protein
LGPTPPPTHTPIDPRPFEQEEQIDTTYLDADHESSDDTEGQEDPELG